MYVWWKLIDYHVPQSVQMQAHQAYVVTVARATHPVTVAVASWNGMIS